MARKWIWHAICCLLLAVLPMRQAAAHAVLELAVPSDRSVLQEAPRHFNLRFDETVAVTDLRLLDPAGKPIKIDVQSVDGAIDATIEEPLAAGTYTIGYRVISADGHPVAGAIQFQIGAGDAHWSEAADGLAWWQWGKLACRWLLYLGAFLTWGTIMHRLQRHVTAETLTSPPKPVLFMAAPATVIALAAAILAIGLQGIGMSGGGWRDLLWPAIWRSGATAPDGHVALLMISGLALAWLAWYGRHLNTFARTTIVLSALVLVAAFATSGHVWAIGWLATFVLAVHVVGALLWVGSLGSLLRHPVAQPSTRIAAAKLKRRVVIAFVIAAGIALACWQIVTPGMLLGSAYGWVLTVKMAAVLLVLGFAAANRWAVVPAAPKRRLLLAWGQALLLVAVLGLTAALGQLPPPRHQLAVEAAAAVQAAAGHAGHQELLDTMIHLPDAMAEISIEANGAGGYDLAVWLDDIYERRLNPQQVTVNLSNLDAGLGPLSRELTPNAEDGSYVLRGIKLSPSGRWRVEIKADVSDFDRRIFRTEVVVPE